MTNAVELMENEIEMSQLDVVAGGFAGYNPIHKEAVYNAHGIKTSWGLLKKDEFWYRGKSIDGDTATAIVYHLHKNGLNSLNNMTVDNAIATATSTKANDIKGYKRYLKNINA